MKMWKNTRQKLVRTVQFEPGISKTDENISMPVIKSQTGLINVKTEKHKKMYAENLN